MRFFQSVLYLKRRVAVKKSLLEHHKLSRNTHVSQGCSVGSKKALGFCFALMYKTTARPLSGQSLLSQPTYRQFPRFMRRVQQRCSALCLRDPAWASIIVSLVLPKDWSSIECVCWVWAIGYRYSTEDMLTRETANLNTKKSLSTGVEQLVKARFVFIWKEEEKEHHGAILKMLNHLGRSIDTKGIKIVTKK